MPKSSKTLPKWRNFAASSHTDCFPFKNIMKAKWAILSHFKKALTKHLKKRPGLAHLKKNKKHLRQQLMPSKSFFSNWFIPSLVFVYFRLFEPCTSIIHWWDSNPQPSEHESPSITTRPGFPPYLHNLTCWSLTR